MLILYENIPLHVLDIKILFVKNLHYFYWMIIKIVMKMSSFISQAVFEVNHLIMDISHVLMFDMLQEVYAYVPAESITYF